MPITRGGRVFVDLGVAALRVTLTDHDPIVLPAHSGAYTGTSPGGGKPRPPVTAQHQSREHHAMTPCRA